MTEYSSVTRDRGGAVTDSIFDDSGYVGDENDADSDPALNDDDDDDDREYGDPTGAPSYEDYGSVTRDRDRDDDDGGREWTVTSSSDLSDRGGAVTDSIFDDSGYVGDNNSAATDPALSGTDTQQQARQAQAAMGGDLPIAEAVAVVAIVAAAYLYGSR